MFLFYTIIYFLDICKKWNTLFEEFQEREVQQGNTKQNDSDFESPKDTTNSEFRNNESQDCMVFIYNKIHLLSRLESEKMVKSNEITSW